MDNDPLSFKFCFKFHGLRLVNGGTNSTWQVILTVTGSTLEQNLANNQVVHDLTLTIPNLNFDTNNIELVGLQDAQGNFLPGSDLNVTATVRNESNVRTQEGIFFGVTAQLLEGSQVLDQEMVILPRLNTVAGLPIAFIDARGEAVVNFPPLQNTNGCSRQPGSPTGN